MTKDADQKLDAILDAIKSLEARVARIETGSTDAGAGQGTATGAAAKKLSIKERVGWISKA